MDGFYRGIETSLLAISFMLVVTVAALSGSPRSLAGVGGPETTLPMITVPGEADED